jgi:O-antigen ligase
MSKDVTGYDYTTSDATGFALVSNIVVAKENLFNSRFMGSGINTHQYAYYQTIYSKFPESSLLNLLNVKDAGSLFIRIISDFGIPGIFFFLYFLYKNKIRIYYEKATEDMLLNNLSFIMILSFSFRNGEYLSPFLWFFIAILYYTKKNNNLKLIPQN